jgi:hypothetical protein
MSASKLVTPVALALFVGLGAAVSADDFGCQRRTVDYSYSRPYRYHDYDRADRYYNDARDADYYYDAPYYRPSGYGVYRRDYWPSYRHRYYNRYYTRRPRVYVRVGF